MKFEVPCECGNKLIVTAGDAGSTLGCKCGRTVEVPGLATAAVHGMQYLMTWNCTHIANVAFRSRIEATCRAAGYEPPLICTPEELPPPEEES